MKRKIFSFVTIMLLALTCAYAGGGKKDFAIIYIGNSITYGALHENRNETAPPVYTSQMLAKKFKANVIWRNCGWSGATTYDFLPSHKRYFPRVEKAVREIQAETSAPIVFSIMLGTNDSACTGPTGCPVSNDDYKKNLITILSVVEEVLEARSIVSKQLVAGEYEELVTAIENPVALGSHEWLIILILGEYYLVAGSYE